MKKIIVVLLMVLFAASAFADYYWYFNENGPIGKGTGGAGGITGPNEEFGVRQDYRASLHLIFRDSTTNAETPFMTIEIKNFENGIVWNDWDLKFIREGFLVQKAKSNEYSTYNNNAPNSSTLTPFTDPTIASFQVTFGSRDNDDILTFQWKGNNSELMKAYKAAAPVAPGTPASPGTPATPGTPLAPTMTFFYLKVAASEDSAAFSGATDSDDKVLTELAKFKVRTVETNPQPLGVDQKRFTPGSNHEAEGLTPGWYLELKLEKGKKYTIAYENGSTVKKYERKDSSGTMKSVSITVDSAGKITLDPPKT